MRVKRELPLNQTKNRKIKVRDEESLPEMVGLLLRKVRETQNLNHENSESSLSKPTWPQKHKTIKKERERTTMSEVGV